ncbi:ufm1-specific protease 2-like [Cimex lectularius]|uniref:Ufm1-specific protease 2 n=1 Tax=Cimex lectularius TaxID=79782 RepID=A0A8I6SGA1_CIMLE|nr:ufm1-specific protease 2-like [Cimex lectularius]
MAETVLLLQNFHEKIKTKTTQGNGLLYGIPCGTTIVILGACFNNTEKLINAEAMICKLPSGVQKLGLVEVNNEANLTDFPNSCQMEFQGFILMKDIKSERIQLKKMVQHNFHTVPFNVIDSNEFNSLVMTMRVKGNFSLGVSDTGELQNCIHHLKNQITTNEWFGVKIDESENCITEKSLQNNKNSISELSVDTSSKSKIDLNLSVLEPKSQNVGDDLKSMVYTTELPLTKKQNKLCINICIDALCITWKKTAQSVFIENIKQCIINYLSLYYDAYCKEMSAMSVLKSYHFSPEPLGHPLTIIYSKSKKDDIHESEREKLHILFDLPLNQPYFRKGCSITSHNLISKTCPITNVHVGLSPSGLTNGKCVVIKRNYSYFHYMQNNFNDSGWGCAYRSLQTIFSWYLWQGYTDCKVPDHKDIQECLVKLRDKPKSFINSKQWIGSNEIAFCLDEMIGVQCEICHISSREELVNYGSKLEAHFLFNDTPVMIGGGQLAHTIIGTHFNREEGEIRFLVLDPHYIGKDDIKSIQSKGGVAWRPITFWEKNTFFNLCLPKSPKVAY